MRKVRKSRKVLSNIVRYYKKVHNPGLCKIDDELNICEFCVSEPICLILKT